MEHARHIMILAIMLMVAAYVFVFVFRALASRSHSLFKTQLNIAKDTAIIDIALKKEDKQFHERLEHEKHTRIPMRESEKFKEETLQHMEQGEAVFPEVHHNPGKKPDTTGET